MFEVFEGIYNQQVACHIMQMCMESAMSVATAMDAVGEYIRKVLNLIPL